MATTKKTAPPAATQTTVIKAPDIRTIAFNISGTAPYVQARFSGKAMQSMMSKMAAGSVAARKPRTLRISAK